MRIKAIILFTFLSVVAYSQKATYYKNGQDGIEILTNRIIMIKLKVNNEEIVRSKFNKTIAKIEGYSTEARGDLTHGTTYSANAVHRRMEAIKQAFYEDIAAFAKDIKLGSGPKSLDSNT